MFNNKTSHTIEKTKKKPFSKKLGAKIISSCLLAACMTSATVDAAFYGTNGTQIISDGANPTSDPVYLKGINLGNWLLWEGYMMVGDYVYMTHTQFFDQMHTNVFNGNLTDAKMFEHTWRENYVTEQTIIELKNKGFNSVRVPFNYKMFWDDAAGALKSGNDPITGVDPFHYLDNLVSWCEQHNIRILLDMHALPGAQNPGDHSDNNDSDETQPRDSVKFWDADPAVQNPVYPDDYPNIMIAKEVWKHIANYYKDTEVIWGYDLMNEPVAQAGRESEVLPSLVEIRDSIREVDNNHIIVAEPNWWASQPESLDWTDPAIQSATGITAQWDTKLVYELHHYVFGNKAETLGRMSDRVQQINDLNIPTILGEFGEDSEDIMRALADHTYYGEDLNGNGILDSTAEDCNYNDVIDPGEDVNGNGSLDPGEDSNCDGVLQSPIAGDFFWSAKKVWAHRTLWIVPISADYQTVIDCATTGACSGPANRYRDRAFAFAENDILQGSSTQVYEQGTYDAIRIDGGCAAATPISITGRVEAEDHCRAFNTAPGGANGFYVGYTDPGDYFDLRINVPSAGDYTVDYRVATQDDNGGTNVFANALDFRIDSASVLVDGYVAKATTTGGWEAFVTESSAVTLPAGDHTLRVYFNQGPINIDWLEFTSMSGPAPAPALADGVYKIKTLSNSKYMGCNDAVNGCNVITRRSGGAGNKILWQVTNLGNGAYRLENLHANKSLNVDSWSWDDGANIQLWDWSGGNANEMFTIQQDVANTAVWNVLNIKEDANGNGVLDAGEDMDGSGDLGGSGKALDVSSDNVQQWTLFGGPNQQWEFIAQ